MSTQEKSDTTNPVDSSYFPSYQSNDGGFDENYRQAIGEMLEHKYKPRVFFINPEGFKLMMEEIGVDEIPEFVHPFVGMYAGTPVILNPQSPFKFEMCGTQ